MDNFFEKKVIKEPFEKAKEKYGIFPTTTWDINYSDKLTQELKEEIGDGVTSFERNNSWNAGGGYKNDYWKSGRQKGLSCGKDFTRQGTGSLGYKSARKDCFTRQTEDESIYRGKITESIFSPQISQYILNIFAPKEKESIIFDPFAGGGTRAIMSIKNDYNYIGYELRQEEVDAVQQRLKNTNCEKAKIICGNSQNCDKIENNYADFLITCPPYYNLEMYEGGENDLSMCNTYEDFLKGIELVIKETYRILKENSLSCWVIGLHREKNGNLLSMHHDISYLHKKCGFNFKEEVILCHKNNGAIQRVGNFENGANLLIRTHEYLLVFKKGKIR